jgi:hypothetical protein
MKKITLSALFLFSVVAFACEKNKSNNPTDDGTIPCPGNPRANVSASLQGTWMYGQFSLKEYWSTNPSTYLGNALQMAIAFKFNAHGTYEQYFTSSSVMGTVVTYQQSVTKGTVVIDEAGKIIKTYACSAHYKRTKNGQTVEERDLRPDELTILSQYTFDPRTEPNGTKAIYLKLNGTGTELAFLKK